MKKRIFFALPLFCAIPFLLAFSPHEGSEEAPDSSLFAAPAGIGQDGPFDAQNIQVLGHLTLAEMGGGAANVLGNDCWGWTDSTTTKEYAICGLENGTSFIDVSDPTNPLYLGFLPTHSEVSTWRDIKVFDDHAFIVADANPGHGMQVFDLTQLRTADSKFPSTFSNTAHYSGIGSAHNIAINEDSGYAYIVGSDTTEGGLHVVNINDPTNPAFAGSYAGDGYVHDCQAVNYAGPDTDYQGQEIAFCCNGRVSSDDDTFVIVNATNKNNMTRIARVNYPQPGYSHQGWLSDDQRYFYLGDELDEGSFGGQTRILIWDCLDLDTPVFMGVFLGPTNAVDHNMYIRDDLLFLSNYAAGMRVFQIDPSDPMNLTEVAYVDTYMTDDDADFDGVWSNYPYFESGTIVINDRQNGMFAVRISPIDIQFPNGLPEQIEPDGIVEFQVNVVDGFDGTPAPGSGMLHVDTGNGFVSYPMNETSPNVYDAAFPPSDCGSVVNYFVSAMSTGGVEVRIPANAPASFHSTLSTDSTTTSFFDDFESSLTWTVSGDASDGQWERGVPDGDGDRGDPLTDNDGSGSCYLTDNEAGNSDVDDGTTILTSPTMDAVGDGTAVASFLKYHRWFSNNVGNSGASDTMVVDISNDNGQSWTTVETVGPAGNEVSGGWFVKTFDIEDFVIPTDQMRIRFSVSDLGDGSVVEGAVDGVEVFLAFCDDEVLHGDVNLDGVINLLDVSPFVAVLANSGFQAEADMNKDGFVNLLDVDMFIDALSGN